MSRVDFQAWPLALPLGVVILFSRITLFLYAKKLGSTQTDLMGCWKWR